MSKPGRNDPCPCASGRKYKHCCLDKSPSPYDGAISIPPPDEADEEKALSMTMLKQFLAVRGDKEIGSMEQFNAEFKAFAARGSASPVEAFEGLSLNQMNSVLYTPLNCPGIIRIANRVDAGPDVPILMMLHEMRMAIEANKDIACTRTRELQPRLVQHIYDKFRLMRPYDRLLEPVRVRTEMDAPIVRAARAVLKVSGHLRTYANRFILSSSCRTQLYNSEYSFIYTDIFRSYALRFNWSYWGSVFEVDPYQYFFCYTLFQLARHGDSFVSPEDYAIGFYRAFPKIAHDLVGDDESLDAMDFPVYLYVTHIVVQFWGFFGLVEFADTDPDSDEMPFVRATRLFRELIQFPEEWLVDL